ncbi:hypothetical protein [Sodalis sp. dw_96]|uniref:hypothetical protein n=1 Tax=Sodalis sp. dw_96 TaxID=2719794 RepID=UPI001BD2AAB6|nr:hypothetical protein [Sodalis sp. dw_96]
MRKTLTPEEIEKLRTSAKWDCTFGRVTMTKLLDHIDALDHADKIQVRAIDNLNAKIDSLEAELAQRDALAGEPVGYFTKFCGIWHEVHAPNGTALYIASVVSTMCLPSIYALNEHEKTRLIEFAEKYIQRQSKIIAKLPTDICQEKLIGIALETLNAPPAPVTGINANHSDPDLSPGEYSVNISTKGGAAIINGAPVASVLLDTAKILDTPFLEGDSIYWQLVTGLVDQENEQREIFAAEIVRAIINAAGMQPVSAVPVVFTPILTELERAIRKFPTWPTDPIHASKILDEEVGELSKAVLQATYEPHKSGPDEVRAEAIQAAAMCIRFIASLDRYQYTPATQHEQPALAHGHKAVNHG